MYVLCVLPPPPSTTSAEAVVMFEYEKQLDDELDLKIGDIIQDVQQVSGCTHLLVCMTTDAGGIRNAQASTLAVIYVCCFG